MKYSEVQHCQNMSTTNPKQRIFGSAENALIKTLLQSAQMPLESIDFPMDNLRIVGQRANVLKIVVVRTLL